MTRSSMREARLYERVSIVANDVHDECPPLKRLAHAISVFENPLQLQSRELARAWASGLFSNFQVKAEAPSNSSYPHVHHPPSTFGS